MRFPVTGRPALPLALLAVCAGALCVAMLGAVPAPAAPNVGQDRPQARQRQRAEPLPAEPRGRQQRRNAPEAEEDRDEPQGPAGCPDRGQPLELIV